MMGLVPLLPQPATSKSISAYATNRERKTKLLRLLALTAYLLSCLTTVMERGIMA